MKMDDSAKQFMEQYDDVIDDQVHQDMVRLEQMVREWDTGQTKELVDAMVNSSSYMYQSALNGGFSDEQSFDMALKLVGLN